MKILSSKHVGAPVFLGLDDAGAPVTSTDPARVSQWMADGFRYEFNRLRAHRSKWVYVNDDTEVPEGAEVVLDAKGSRRFLRTLGENPATWSNPQLRSQRPFMASLPSTLLHSVVNLENTDWFAATKRRSTLASKGKNPGRMPGFRSRKRDSHTFCLLSRFRARTGDYEQARLKVTGKRTGILTITGSNPAGTTGVKRTSWAIQYRLRLTQTIRPYTSVKINTVAGTIVFVNPVKTLTQHEDAAKNTVGVDRGVAHLAVTDMGEFFTLDRDKLRALDKRARKNQGAAARARRRWLQEHPDAKPKDYQPKGRAHRAEQAFRADRAKMVRIVEDAAHKAATALVRNNNTIIIENLSLTNMLTKAKPIPDPLREGKYLHNGAAAKRGLNRAIAQTGLGRLKDFLAYRLQATGGTLIEVPAQYTSQRCHKCGHTQKENRESQAVFSCKNPACQYTGNADYNAACNIAWIAKENKLKPIKPDTPYPVPAVGETGADQPQALALQPAQPGL